MSWGRKLFNHVVNVNPREILLFVIGECKNRKGCYSEMVTTKIWVDSQYVAARKKARQNSAEQFVGVVDWSEERLNSTKIRYKQCYSQ